MSSDKPDSTVYVICTIHSHAGTHACMYTDDMCHTCIAESRLTVQWSNVLNEDHEDGKCVKPSSW